MRIRLRSVVFSLFLGLGLLVLSAASASAFSTNLATNLTYGTILTTGDTVTMKVDFNSTGNDIQVLSVSVLFDDNAFAWDQAASSSPTYALYNAGGRGNAYLAQLNSNLTLRAGTSNQILLDWVSSDVPEGTRDQCGDYGTYPAVPGGLSGNGCGFRMAKLVFRVIHVGEAYGASFTLSNSSPGNIFALGDGSQPVNTITYSPEPTTALLVGLGLAGLGVAGRRRSSPPHPQARQDRGRRQAQSGPE